MTPGALGLLCALCVGWFMFTVWLYARLDPPLMPALWLHGGLLVLAWLFVRAWIRRNNLEQNAWSMLGFNPVKFTWLALALLMAVALWWLDHWLQGLTGDRDVSGDLVYIRSASAQYGALATVFAVCVAAPLVEEMLFRGALLGSLKTVVGALAAALISAAAFTAIHLTWAQAPILFVAALMYAWLSVRSGSILPAIAAHALNNAMSYFYLAGV